MRIIISTPLHPTEDRAKVEQCLQNILSNPDIEEEDDTFIVTSTNADILAPIREKLKGQRIRDSARKVLLSNLNYEPFTFYLHKQAAFAGRIHFVTDQDQEDFLGPITITVEASEEELRKLINWLTMVDFEAD
ncbi:MAG: RNA-binding domain-containing protein [Candidatus Helarchaeota archaeon]